MITARPPAVAALPDVAVAAAQSPRGNAAPVKFAHAWPEPVVALEAAQVTVAADVTEEMAKIHSSFAGRKYIVRTPLLPNPAPIGPEPPVKAGAKAPIEHGALERQRIADPAIQGVAPLPLPMTVVAKAPDHVDAPIEVEALEIDSAPVPVLVRDGSHRTAPAASASNPVVPVAGISAAPLLVVPDMPSEPKLFFSPANIAGAAAVSPVGHIARVPGASADDVMPSNVSSPNSTTAVVAQPVPVVAHVPVEAAPIPSPTPPPPSREIAGPTAASHREGRDFPAAVVPPPAPLLAPILGANEPSPRATATQLLQYAPSPISTPAGFAVETFALGGVAAEVTHRPGRPDDRLSVHFAVDRDATAVLIARDSVGLDHALVAAGARLDTVSVEVRSGPAAGGGTASGFDTSGARGRDPRRDPQPVFRPVRRALPLRATASSDRFA